MAPEFEKSNEIYFRLGIIYKQQQKYRESLEVRVSALSLARRISNGFRSASNTSFPTLRLRSLRRTSGSRLAMSTSSKKM